MVKIFRKIRQNLLSENRVGKYLLYAIGEIILVVLGILIAVQINSESTFRKNKIIEYEILVDLKIEFEANLQELEKSIKISNDIAYNSKKLLMACWDDYKPISEDSLRSLIGSSFMYSEQEFKYDNSVQLELINTGKQSLINSKEIRKFISSCNKQLELVNYQEKVVDQYRQRSIDIYLNLGNNAVLMNKDFVSSMESKQIRTNLSLLESLPFENTLGIYEGTSRHLAEVKYNDMKEKISDVIALIDTSLNNYHFYKH